MFLPGGPDDDPERQQKFEALAAAMAGFGGKTVEIRFGLATLSWGAGAGSSSTATVSHGVGRTPVVVVACQQGTGGPTIAVCQTRTLTTTTFDLQATFQSGVAAAALNSTFAWIAVG